MDDDEDVAWVQDGRFVDGSRLGGLGPAVEGHIAVSSGHLGDLWAGIEGNANLSRM